MFLLQLNGLSKSEDIPYICELFFETTRIPICFVNRDHDIPFAFRHGLSTEPPFADHPSFDHPSMDQQEVDTIPFFFTNTFLENYFTIALIQQNTYMGRMIAGPALTSSMNNEMINTLITEHRISLSKKAELWSYYQTLPVVDYKQMVNASMLLYYAVYNKKLDSTVILEKNAQINRIYQKLDHEINHELLMNRQYTIYHHTPLYEKHLLQYVKEGNKERLLDHLGKYPGGQAGVLAKNPLRSQKNLFICGATLITRAAIEGGLDSELALTVSDSYIQQAEEMTEISEIISLHYKMVLDFTERVHSVKEHNYSRSIAKCCNHIFQHLYQDISLQELSEIAGVNPNYLSELFKKEVGIPITEYIQRERVEEAKKLLTLTDQSIMDICVGLNFNDQSYFTKVFKKFIGITPKQYRNIHSQS